MACGITIVIFSEYIFSDCTSLSLTPPSPYRPHSFSAVDDLLSYIIGIGYLSFAIFFGSVMVVNLPIVWLSADDFHNTESCGSVWKGCVNERCVLIWQMFVSKFYRLWWIYSNELTSLSALVLLEPLKLWLTYPQVFVASEYYHRTVHQW